MSERVKIGIGIACAAIVLVIIGMLMFTSRAKTPEYAIQMVEDSISTHDKNKFEKSVNIDKLLDTSYDSFVDAMIDFDKTMPPEIKDSITNFTQLLKVPMMASMKTAIENYIVTGSFDLQNEDKENASELDERIIAASEFLSRAGLNKLEFRQIDSVKVDDNNSNQAIAEVRVYQQEAARDFVFEVMLEKNQSNEWQVVGIKNFRNFISMVNQTRRTQLDKYLEQTAEIITRHDKTIREAEQKYGSILSIGSLGQDDTRDDLKTLITDVVKKDWEVRKQELFNVSVPKGAEALQNLRIKICDLSIESADLYAKWMSDKKSATIKEAEDKRKQAQTLLEEEKLLVARMIK